MCEFVCLLAHVRGYVRAYVFVACVRAFGARGTIGPSFHPQALRSIAMNSTTLPLYKICIFPPIPRNNSVRACQEQSRRSNRRRSWRAHYRWKLEAYRTRGWPDCISSRIRRCQNTKCQCFWRRWVHSISRGRNFGHCWRLAVVALCACSTQRCSQSVLERIAF